MPVSSTVDAAKQRDVLCENLSADSIAPPPVFAPWDYYWRLNAQILQSWMRVWAGAASAFNTSCAGVPFGLYECACAPRTEANEDGDNKNGAGGDKDNETPPPEERDAPVDEDDIDEAVEESFPASDPPSYNPGQARPMGPAQHSA